eukprot:9480780-Pyramimonas_sp.AAC.2
MLDRILRRYIRPDCGGHIHEQVALAQVPYPLSATTFVSIAVGLHLSTAPHIRASLSIVHSTPHCMNRSRVYTMGKNINKYK